MDNEQKIKELASQLRNPTGEKGIEIGKMMYNTNKNMIFQSLNQLNLHRNETILELGYGNGAHIPDLISKYNIIYYGLEISSLMQEQAKINNKNLFHKYPPSLELYDGYTIPFSNNFFDKVFTVNTIYFWEYPEKFIHEMIRVTKPKGVISVTFIQKFFLERLPFSRYGFNLYDNEKILDLVTKTSLNINSIITESEQIKHKSGEFLTRTFTIITIKK